MSDTSSKGDNLFLPWVKDGQIVSISIVNANGKTGGSLKLLDKNGRLKVVTGGGRQSQWLVEVVDSGADMDGAPRMVRLKSRFNGKFLRVRWVKADGLRVEANGTLSEKEPEELVFAVVSGDAEGSTAKGVFQLQCQAHRQERYVGRAPLQSGAGESSAARDVVAAVRGDDTYWTVKQASAK